MNDPPGAPAASGDVSRAERELDDALYYLRHGRAQRHLDLARRYGATQEQVRAVRAAGSAHKR